MPRILELLGCAWRRGQEVSSITQALAGAKPAKLLRGIVLPALVASIALTVAVVGALIVNDASGQDGVNLFVESLSGRSAGGLGFLAPLGFAFAAGAAAAFNPCGFAMLPAYMGLYLGAGDSERDRKNPFVQLAKALLVGGAVTAGFVVLFAVAGTIIGLGARSLVADVLPWLGLGIGIVLAIAGAWLLTGGKLYTALAARAAARMGDPSKVNVRGYFLFGVSYGTASLSCTLPIFLAVIGTSFAVSSIATSFSQFVLYGLGMGMVIIALTVGMALFRGTMVGAMRKAIPHMQPVGSWLMVIAGAYIVFYWLSIGGLLD